MSHFRYDAIQQCARMYAEKDQPYRTLNAEVVSVRWPLVRKEAFINDVLTLVGVQNTQVEVQTEAQSDGLVGE